VVARNKAHKPQVREAEMRRFINCRIGLIALVACAPQVMMAQTAPPNPNSRIPEVRTSDEYGVDLMSGQASYAAFIGSIGSGDQVLSITRRYDSTSDKYSIFFRDDIYPFISDQDSKTTYSSVGVSASFGANGSVLDLAQTLERLPNNDYLITGRDGTQLVFDATASIFYPKPKYILYPNGKKITYSFDSQVISNNFGFEIRRFQTSYAPNPVMHETEFINKAYDSSVSSWFSFNPIWPKASDTFRTSSTSQPIGATYNFWEMKNIFGQTYKPFYTNFLLSNANNAVQGKDFLTKMVTNFDSDHLIDYRGGGLTAAAAGSNTYYISKIRKGGRDINYSGGWSFEFGGYQASIAMQRTTASGEVAQALGSRWSLGIVPKPEFISGASGTTYYTFGTDFGSQGLKSYRDSDGTETIFTRDARDNVTMVRTKAKPGSGVADLVSTAAYPATCTNRKTCNQPTYTIDERGNRTDYAYHDPSGGLQSVTSPAVNGIRAETRNSYVLRNAWIASAAGGYAQIPDPVWLLASTSFCRTSAATGNPAAPCAVAGDEVLTTYDYGPNAGPNNLFLRGVVVTADGQSLRTCYEYDRLGRRVTETEPSANLSSCY
jgi:hypothetical protein